MGMPHLGSDQWETLFPPFVSTSIKVDLVNSIQCKTWAAQKIQSKCRGYLAMRRGSPEDVAGSSQRKISHTSQSAVKFEQPESKGKRSEPEKTQANNRKASEDPLTRVPSTSSQPAAEEP